MQQQLGLAGLGGALGDGRFVAGQIGQGQGRDAGQILGTVRGVLELAQDFEVSGDGGLGGVVQGGGHGGQLGFLLGGAPGVQLGVRGERQGHAVGIIQHPQPHGVFKNLLAGGQPGLEPAQGTGKTQRGQGVAVVQPGGQGAQPQGQSARE